MSNLYNNKECLINKEQSLNTYCQIEEINIAIPIIAYHVKSVQHKNPENIIEKTIIKLKQLGLNSLEISNKLCLDKRLVKYIIESHKNNNEEIEYFPEENEKTGYLFYDCYNENLLYDFMWDENFNENINIEIINRGKNSFIFQKDISSSKRNKVYVLIKQGYKHKIPDEPTPETILNIINLKEHKQIDSTYYSSGEYMHECKEMYLIVKAYISEKEPTLIRIASPYNNNNQNLWIEIQDILKNNYYSNEDLNKELQNMNRSVHDEVNRNRNINNNEYTHKVIRLYGQTIVDVKMDEVLKALSKFEQAYNEYKITINRGQNQKSIIRKNKELVVKTVDLFEVAFEHSFYNLISNDKIRKQLENKFREVNKKNAGFDMLISYLGIIGFTFNEETDLPFIKKTRLNELKAILNYNGNVQSINSWFFANVFCALFCDNAPLYNLAKKMPDLINFFTKIDELRDGAKHDDDNNFDVVADEECNRIYEISHIIVSTLFGMKLNTESFTDNLVEEKIKDQDLQILIKEKLNNINIKNNKLKEKAEEMCGDFYSKNTEIFSTASNLLVAFYTEKILAYKLNEEEISKFIEPLETKDELTEQLNKILKENGIDYCVSLKISKQKLYNYENIHLMSDLQLMFILIIIMDKTKKYIFKNKNDIGELFRITEYIHERRGHRTDINSNEDFMSEEELDKILALISKDGE